MTRNPSRNMNVDPEEERPVSDAASSYLAQYLPDRNTAPVDLNVVTTSMGLTGPRIPAKELVDHTFVILGAKPFSSSFSDDNTPYFCVIKDEAADLIYTTVLGGGAVVEMLRALAEAGFDAPIRVTLREVKGGRFGRYYVLE